MKKLICLLALVNINYLSAQDIPPLYASQEPLNLKVTGSIKSIKKNTNDSTFIVGMFQYLDGADWIKVTTDARTRGNFRLKNCFFPPLKLKFDKKEIASTVFAGNKALKLVFPCKDGREKNELVRKEYLCYKFYEVFSKFSFRTRLAKIDLSETSLKRKTREYELLGFFVEDNDLVAKRNGGKVMEMKAVNPAAFDERNALRNDYFQFMIGNADWSAVYSHNSNVLYVDKMYIPLPYDFDMSGFVNATYAHDNPPNLGTGNPRERVYRGFCKDPLVMEEIRREFLLKERLIQNIIDSESNHFSKFELDDMHDYVNDFFKILRDGDQFQMSVLKGCRTANP